ncbi:MAG: transglycosylase domain-containing protein [Terrimicrobiaceae bacterium]|nr:transglycosylase domain-containing protein [Terrimicrobiaceae bacterium]
MPILIAAIALASWLAFESSIRHAPIPPAGPAPATPVLLDMRGQPFARPSASDVRDQRPVTLRNMGRWLPLATVAIEDRRFWRHHGVDWTATAGAALRNVRNLRVISGASTITQQTVKILTGRSRRTLDLKAREALSALALDRQWSKERILETYLNRIDYGNRRFGAEAAAQAYFGKPAASLSLAESIFLAGIPQSPTRLNPWTHPDAARRRYEHNVSQLARNHSLPDGITSAQLLAAQPRIERHDPPMLAPHFAALVRNRAGARTGDIRTTLDLDLQHVAETLLREHLRNARSIGIGDAAIVVIDNATGEIRALASAGRAEHSAIDAATVPRSSGSALKPFIYVEAIDRRLLTAATLLPDTPQAISETYADYDPQNYTHRSYGPMRAREALGNSLNVPAVIVTSRLGARDAFNSLRRWGFQFPRNFDAYGAGFILGNADVRLVDLAGAYAGLARGGIAWPARALAGESIESARLASPEAAAIVTDILCDNNARRLSFGLNSPLDLGVRVAVKTGTSSGFRDRWCVGFDREHTVAVWAGNLDGRSLGEVLAVRAAAPLWASMMRYFLAHGDTPLPAPAPSAGLIRREVAAETGLLPRPGETTISEWFLAGTEPKSGAASMYAKIAGRDTLVLPPEYAAWCDSPENRLGAVARSARFDIVFPKDGAIFAWSAHLPVGQQTLTPLSTTPLCDWFLNGRRLDDASIPLARGNWTLTARSAGEERTARFTVE